MTTPSSVASANARAMALSIAVGSFRGIMSYSNVMSGEDETPIVVRDAEVTSAPAGDDAAGDLLALRETAELLVQAKTLVAGLRLLQQRIPQYEQLSVREKQSMTRASTLDPAFLEVGIQTAGAWNQTKALIGRTAEEMRAEAEEIRQWDEVERELLVLAKGVASANLRRKHRLGSAVLTLYKLLGNALRYGFDGHMRPYFDEMKRAFLRRRKKPAKQDEPPAE